MSYTDMVAESLDYLDHLVTMRLLWSVGSIQLQVSFAEYRLFYRALLQKRPMILSITLTEATPHDPRGGAGEGSNQILEICLSMIRDATVWIL